MWGTRSLSHLHTAMEIEATAASHLHADLPEKVASSSPICYRAPRLIFFNDFLGGALAPISALPSFVFTGFCRIFTAPFSQPSRLLLLANSAVLSSS